MRKGLVAVLLLTPMLLWAQEPLKLSFKEAVQIGLDSNIPLKMERNNLTAAEANKNSSFASLAPNLNGRGTGFVNNGNFFIEQEGRVINTESRNLFGSLDANLTIYNGSSRISAAKRDKKLFEAQLSTITRTEQDVISNVAMQFLNVLQDQEQVKIAIQNRDNQQVLYDQISAMFENGSRPITDKYDQEFQLKSAELEVIRAENRLINDKAILAQTLMIDPSTQFELVEPEWSVDDIVIDDYTIDALYEIAMENREDLKAVMFQKDAAESNMKASRGGYIPSLTAFYGISSRWTDATVGRSVEDQFLVDNKRQQYGLNLNIPIFNGLRNRANTTNAKIQHENAVLSVENQEIQIKSDVIQAYQNFRDVATAYQVSLVQYEAGQRSQETQQESYNLGISSLIQLSLANNVFVEGQTSLSRAKYSLMFQKIMMDYAVGILKFEDIPE